MVKINRYLGRIYCQAKSRVVPTWRYCISKIGSARSDRRNEMMTGIVKAGKIVSRLAMNFISVLVSRGMSHCSQVFR
jgi:hypothetical protein